MRCPSKSCKIYSLFVCNGDEPKSGLARGLGDRLQSRNVPFGLPVIEEKDLRCKTKYAIYNADRVK